MSETDRVAFVTGGGSGIGKAVVEAFLADGYRVVACGRTRERLEKAQSEIGIDAPHLTMLTCDVSQRTSVETAISSTVDLHGRLDAVVNAHGVLEPFKTVEELTEEEWDLAIGINLRGPINTCAVAGPHLRATKGSVVNVASISGWLSEPALSPYGTTKAGLLGFTKYAACDLAPHGVRVNAIAPGWVHTPMSAPFFEELGLHGKTLDCNMMGRAAEPKEIAAVALFLASDAASFITGATIVADGGHSPLIAPLRAREED